MILSPQDLVNAVVAWANENSARIGQAWPVQGGWEPWAQVEIAAYINRYVPDNYVEREPHVYVDGSRADLLVNHPVLTDPANRIVVELKCESLGNWRNFVDGIRFDTWKLGGPMNGGLDAAFKLSIGLFFSAQSEDVVNSLTGMTVRYSNDGSIGVAWVGWQGEPNITLPVPGPLPTPSPVTPQHPGPRAPGR